MNTIILEKHTQTPCLEWSCPPFSANNRHGISRRGTKIDTKGYRRYKADLTASLLNQFATTEHLPLFTPDQRLTMGITLTVPLTAKGTYRRIDIDNTLKAMIDTSFSVYNTLLEVNGFPPIDDSQIDDFYPLRRVWVPYTSGYVGNMDVALRVLYATD